MATDTPEKRNEILIITLIFFTIACVAVILRCYVRTRLLRAFGADDVLAVCSLILLSVGVALTCLGLSSGFGQHDSAMSTKEVVTGLKYWCFSEIIYPPIIAMIKTSIALYLIRIAVKPIHIYTIYIPMSLFLVYTIAFFIFLLFQCKPIPFYWRRFEGATDGHCLEPSIVAAMAYGHACLSVLTDLTLGIIPAFIVADLHITTRTKTAVAMTLALGSIASVCTVTRLMYIQDLVTANDYLYSISNVITLSIVEAAVGLTASCLATLKPLVRSFLDWSEKSIASSGIHSRMIEGTKRRRTKIDDTELCSKPELKIVEFTTTTTSSNGQESPPAAHLSLNQPVDNMDKSDSGLSSPYGSPNSKWLGASGNGGVRAAEPCY